MDGDDKDCGTDGQVFIGGSRAAATATETTIDLKWKRRRR